MYLADEMNSRAKILVIRFSSIGDIVLTSPVYRILQEQLPHGAEVHLITQKRFAFVQEANPFVNKIWAVEKSGMEVFKELKEENFDYIIDLQNSLRSRSIRKKLGALAFSVNKQNLRKWIQVNLGIWKGPIKHIVDRYLDTLQTFKVSNDGKGLEYFIPSTTKSIEGLLPTDFIENKYTVIAVGGAHEGKRWSEENWVELSREFQNERIIWIGGKEDSIQLNHSPLHLDLIGKCNVHESGRIIQHAKAVICGDTGMMHIAAAFKKDIVVLWGCTAPELGMGVYRPQAIIGEHMHSVYLQSKRKGRPCSKLGNHCKYGMHNKCIDVIHVNHVVNAFNKLKNKWQ
jgi:ADP-heptose:LPS heptosyltransferase